MEKKMENEMETGGIWGFKEQKLSYYIGETLLFTIYTHYGKLILLIAGLFSLLQP